MRKSSHSLPAPTEAPVGLSVSVIQNRKLEEMTIMKYAIKVNEVKNRDGNIRGFATLTFGDSFKVTNIAIVEGREPGKLFVSMPRYKSNEKDKNGDTIYKDVCNPITSGFRKELYGNILEAFERIKDNQKETMVADKDDKEMPKISVSVTPFEREGSSIRGLARVFINDSFIVSNITILQGKNDVFVAMPSYKTKQVDEHGKAIYQDLCYPVTKEFRDKLYGAVLDTYRKQKDKNQSELAGRMKEQEQRGFQPAKEQETPFR